MKKGWLCAVAAVLSSILLLVGCGKSSTASQTSDAIDTTPVTLVYATNLGLTQDDFQKQIADPVHAKFPYITMQYIARDNGNDLKNLVANGTNIDIYSYPYDRFPAYIQDLGLQFDHSQVIKKFHFDINTLSPIAMQVLNNVSDGKGIYGLPIQLGAGVLYYNKDVFDKFGVAYPKDGMTWDQVISLARQMTRTVEGVQYRGLNSFYSILIRENQLSLPAVAQNADQADIMNDNWKLLYSTLQSIYSIPGNARTPGKDTTSEVQIFWKSKTVAMDAMNFGQEPAFGDFTNWDMVSLPTFPQKPGIGMQSSPTIYSVLSSSQHKDQAFQVLAYLASDEHQKWIAEQGGIPASVNPAVIKAFGANRPDLKGKNVGAVFFDKAAPPPARRDPTLMHDSQQTMQIAINHLNDVIVDQKDINTALSSASDEINKTLATMKQSQ
ncbi:MAG: hypothetical protein JWN30_521 [Bacilli bacterium]|nr:hypothetical protein [Bacilli bacterium]